MAIVLGDDDESTFCIGSASAWLWHSQSAITVQSSPCSNDVELIVNELCLCRISFHLTFPSLLSRSHFICARRVLGGRVWRRGVCFSSVTAACSGIDVAGTAACSRLQCAAAPSTSRHGASLCKEVLTSSAAADGGHRHARVDCISAAFALDGQTHELNAHIVAPHYCCRCW